MDVKVFFLKTGQEFCGVLSDDQPLNPDIYSITHLTVPILNQANKVSLVPMSLSTPNITMEFTKEELRLIVAAPQGLVDQYKILFNNSAEIIKPNAADIAKSSITRVK